MLKLDHAVRLIAVITRLIFTASECFQAGKRQVLSEHVYKYRNPAQTRFMLTQSVGITARLRLLYIPARCNSYPWVVVHDGTWCRQFVCLFYVDFPKRMSI